MAKKQLTQGEKDARKMKRNQAIRDLHAQLYPDSAKSTFGKNQDDRIKANQKEKKDKFKKSTDFMASMPGSVTDDAFKIKMENKAANNKQDYLGLTNLAGDQDRTDMTSNALGLRSEKKGWDGKFKM